MSVVNSFTELGCGAELGQNSIGAGNTFQSIEAGQRMCGVNAAFTPPVSIDNMSPPMRPDTPVPGYKFFTKGQEGLKPHVHVETAQNKQAAFWLDPVSVKEKGDMRSDELKEAAKYVESNKETFIRQYREYYPLPDKPQKEPKQKK